MSRTFWTEKKIEKAITEIVEKYDMDRMPSNSELIMYRGSSDLSNAITKRGGLYHWANKLGLEVKNSETKLGKRYEHIIAERLHRLGYEVKMMPARHPYDLLVNRRVKIDVKVSHLITRPDKGNYFTFNLENEYSSCDLYILIALEQEAEIVKIIPNTHLEVKQLSHGRESMYDIYNDRWDYVEVYDRFYESISI